MGLTVRMSLPEGGELLLDGHTFDPRIPYAAGESVSIMIKPTGGYQFALDVDQLGALRRRAGPLLPARQGHLPQLGPQLRPTGVFQPIAPLSEHAQVRFALEHR